MKHEDIVRALKARLEAIEDYPLEHLRIHPTLDRLQQCQSVDANLLMRALRMLQGHPAERKFGALLSNLQRYPHHTVLEVSGFQLQGLITALSEPPKPGKEASNG